jgi:hypothetical protein
VAAFFDLTKKAAKGDAAAAAEVLLTRMDFGIVKRADAEAKGKTLKLSADQQKRFKAALYDLEVREAVLDMKTPAAGIAIGKQFWADYKGKKSPTGDAAFATFWNYIVGYARAEKDVKAFEAAVDQYKTRYENDAARKADLDKLEKELAALKRGK